MSNHVHIATTPHEHDSLAQLMKNLNQRYVAYMNKGHDRTGTMWEGRFRSCLILDHDYFLTCMRYIELNPVRAGMVGHPREYPWSSYRANAEGSDNSCITAHSHYLALGPNELERRNAYRELVARPAEDQAIELIRCATNANHVLGDSSTMEELAASLTHRLPPGQRGRTRKGPQ